MKESTDHNKESTGKEMREAQERRPSSLPYFWLANDEITEKESVTQVFHNFWGRADKEASH
jgi:ATP-dependent Clp protease adapter protein ClpS